MLFLGRGLLEPILPLLGEGVGTPWRGRQFITGPHNNTHTHTYTVQQQY